MLKSAPPRGPRGASSTRGGSARGGGIQKRKTARGPTRVDKDGDLVMDPAGEKNKVGNRPARTIVRSHGRPVRGGYSRGGTMASQRSQQALVRGLNGKQANVRGYNSGPALRVGGLGRSNAASNEDGGLEALLGFLEKKANQSDPTRPVKINKSHLQGDAAIIYASKEDLERIEKLSGIKFAGQSLSITPFGSHKPVETKVEISPKAAETKERLRAILAGRYDASLKLLNLSGLANDEGLKAMGVFDGTTTTSKIFPALMVVCDNLFKSEVEKSEAIISVTLADNGLVDVSGVKTLAQTFPGLKNIDLSNNNIADVKSLDDWKLKFRHLENLLLAANPIEARLQTEKDELLKRYPRLHILNGVQVRSAEEIDNLIAQFKLKRLPFPIAGPKFQDVAQVGENFIRQFFPLYDMDRNSLLANYYDNKSTFSLSVNMIAPRDRKVSRVIPAWIPYKQLSRNLTKITHTSAQVSRQYKGSQAIHEVWSSLPATRHPDLQTESAKYIIECHPTPGLPDPSGQNPGGVDGLMITIHGEFEEPNPNPEKGDEQAFRSFSRTFILGPGAPGNPPIRVISDIVALRAWAPLASQAAPIVPAAPVAPVIQQPLQPTPDQQTQEAIAMQLVEKSGMTVAYAVLCLTETGWDLEKAFVAFTLNKDKLPAEAFITR